MNGDAASAAAAALVAEGIEAVACAGDVGKSADANAMVSAAVRHFGGVDILVANAGLVRAAAFLDMTEEARARREAEDRLGVESRCCPPGSDGPGFAGFRRGAARELERSIPGANDQAGRGAPCAVLRWAYADATGLRAQTSQAAARQMVAQNGASPGRGGCIVTMSRRAQGCVRCAQHAAAHPLLVFCSQREWDDGYPEHRRVQRI